MGGPHKSTTYQTANANSIEAHQEIPGRTNFVQKKKRCVLSSLLRPLFFFLFSFLQALALKKKGKGSNKKLPFIKANSNGLRPDLHSMGRRQCIFLDDERLSRSQIEEEYARQRATAYEVDRVRQPFGQPTAQKIPINNLEGWLSGLRHWFAKSTYKKIVSWVRIPFPPARK